LRVWPGLIIIAIQWSVYALTRWIDMEQHVQMQAVMSSLFLPPLGLFIWWLFISRIWWRDRFIGFGLLALMGAAVFPLLDSTFEPMVVVFVVIPLISTAAVLICFVASFMSRRPAYLFAVTAMALAWGFFALLRFDGMVDNMGMDLSWRRTPTSEDKNREAINAQLNSLKPSQGADVATVASKPELKPGDWPAFRGANRDARLTGVKIATDWEQNPPREVWRQKMGLGWSSFAVVGGQVFTQLQLDANEMVVCYAADSGKMIWAHKDKARFVERIGGIGPRATPTYHEGKIYALGATGILNCLDAKTGARQWSRDIAADSGAKVPIWGFASSPLVCQGIVTVFAGGPDGNSVLGYKAASGDLAWHDGTGTHSYCSLQSSKLGGVEQLLVASEQGLTSFQPSDGRVLWNYPMDKGKQRVAQPAVLSDSDVLFGSPFGDGIRRLSIGKQGTTWVANDVWASKAISPYFNDLVVQGQHLYGFEGNFLTCVSVENGERKWKARGYGTGQVLLLADQNMLLVLAEDGAVALVEANPAQHVEISRFQAIIGKTWNHPVVAHGKLFVRNGDEAACYQLTEISAGK
jgi:outer membrane protein assembly factor BamB